MKFINFLFIVFLSINSVHGGWLDFLKSSPKKTTIHPINETTPEAPAPVTTELTTQHILVTTTALPKAVTLHFVRISEDDQQQLMEESKSAAPPTSISNAMATEDVLETLKNDIQKVLDKINHDHSHNQTCMLAALETFVQEMEQVIERARNILKEPPTAINLSPVALAVESQVESDLKHAAKDMAIALASKKAELVGQTELDSKLQEATDTLEAAHNTQHISHSLSQTLADHLDESVVKLVKAADVNVTNTADVIQLQHKIDDAAKELLSVAGTQALNSIVQGTLDNQIKEASTQLAGVSHDSKCEDKANGIVNEELKKAADKVIGATDTQKEVVQDTTNAEIVKPKKFSLSKMFKKMTGRGSERKFKETSSDSSSQSADDSIITRSHNKKVSKTSKEKNEEGSDVFSF